MGGYILSVEEEGVVIQRESLQDIVHFGIWTKFYINIKYWALSWLDEKNDISDLKNKSNFSKNIKMNLVFHSLDFPLVAGLFTDLEGI